MLATVKLVAAQNHKKSNLLVCKSNVYRYQQQI